MLLHSPHVKIIILKRQIIQGNPVSNTLNLSKMSWHSTALFFFSLNTSTFNITAYTKKDSIKAVKQSLCMEQRKVEIRFKTAVLLFSATTLWLLKLISESLYNMSFPLSIPVQVPKLSRISSLP